MLLTIQGLTIFLWTLKLPPSKQILDLKQTDPDQKEPAANLMGTSGSFASEGDNRTPHCWVTRSYPS